MEKLETRLLKRIYVSLYAIVFLMVLLGLSVLLEGCSDSCGATHQYTYYEPEYTSLGDNGKAIAVTQPESISSTKKIK